MELELGVVGLSEFAARALRLGLGRVAPLRIAVELDLPASVLRCHLNECHRLPPVSSDLEAAYPAAARHKPGGDRALLFAEVARVIGVEQPTSVGVARWARVDRPSLEELYEVHSPGALRLAYVLVADRDLAQDLVQDPFVRLLDALSGPARSLLE